jgi:hypothetical protein
MNTLEILRQVNIISSLIAVVITGYLLYRVQLKLKESTSPKRRATGLAIIAIAALLFTNSFLLLMTFVAIAIAYDPESVNLLSNIRILVVNIITIFVASIILLIQSGKI